MTDHPSSDELDPDPGGLCRELASLRPFGDEVDDVEGEQLLARLEESLFRRPSEPRTLGRWLILERKGAGAMGVVYAAYDPRLDRRVALKVLRGGRAHRPQAPARMLREAQALAKISDPHVVHIYDVEELEGNVCLVMELIEGNTLEVWQREPRGFTEILDRYIAVAHGLAKIHEVGLVHRDVKPSNVLVDGSRVVIADFGLVLADDAVVSDDRAAPPSHSPTALELTLTEDGALVGTLGYMAPEQLAGAGATARSDQFAFWVSLYEALTGVRPFRGATPRAVAEAMALAGLPRSPRGVPLRRWVYRLLQQGLAVDPEQRFASMAAVEAALERGRNRGRRARNVVLVVGGLGLLGLGYGLLGPTDAGARCATDLADRRLAWDERPAVVAAQARVRGDAVAAAALEDLAQVFDARAAQLHGELVDACQRSVSTAVSPEQRGALAELDDCLLEKDAALRAVLAQLTKADAAALDLAAVDRERARLATLRDCTAEDEPASAREGDPEELVIALEQARAADLYGDHQHAERLADALVQRSHASAAARVEGEALLLRGRAQSLLGRPLPARESLEAAVDAAALAGDRELAARSAVLLAKVLANDLQDPDAARAGLRLARNELVAARAYHEGERGALYANYLEAQGFVAFTEREWAEAEAHHREALGLRQALLRGGAALDDVLKSKNNLANALSRLDRKDEALALHMQVVAEAEERYGASHPLCADAWMNIGNLHRAAERLDEAADAYRRAIAIDRARRGADGLPALRGLLALGVVAQAEDDGATLAEVAAQIEAIHARAMADDPQAMAHPVRADELGLVAAARQAQGDIPGTLDALRRAAAILEPHDEVEHAFALLSLAGVLAEHGPPAEARAVLERALPVLRRAALDGPDAADLASAEALLGRLSD